MSTIALNEKTFAETVSRDGIVLVDFWAAWCGPCRAFGPVFDAASREHPDIVFGKVDTDAESGLAGSLGIMSIPTLMAFRDGIMVFSQPGALPTASLAKLIDAVRGLDMADVRRQVEEASAATRSALAAGRRRRSGETDVQLDERATHEVVQRLRRAEGQLRGVIRMLEEGRDCADVVTQLSAVSHAVDRAGFRLIATGLQQCRDASRDGGAAATDEERLERLFLSLA